MSPIQTKSGKFKQFEGEKQDAEWQSAKQNIMQNDTHSIILSLQGLSLRR